MQVADCKLTHDQIELAYVVGPEKFAVIFLTAAHLVQTAGWMARHVSKRKDVQECEFVHGVTFKHFSFMSGSQVA
jgi:hypothetical protein